MKEKAGKSFTHNLQVLTVIVKNLFSHKAELYKQSYLVIIVYM